MKVSELPEEENVFVDANVYLFNALRFIVTDDADFKRVDWSTVVELEAVP